MLTAAPRTRARATLWDGPKPTTLCSEPQMAAVREREGASSRRRASSAAAKMARVACSNAEVAKTMKETRVSATRRISRLT